jgi:hypothetical protein
MAECCCCIDLELEESALSLDVAETSLTWGTGEYVRVVTSDAEEYDGPYEATPTASAQIFPTTGRLMVREFTVNPIPSNWGLITWNGSTLTVS